MEREVVDFILVSDLGLVRDLKKGGPSTSKSWSIL